MPVTAVVGSQWGDEGKGKIIDLLAREADMVIRFSGGNNAGHTVINASGEFKLHLVPSGIFNPKTTCIISNGVVLDPAALLTEMGHLRSRQVNLSHLYVSSRAHLIMPYHIVLDQLEERERGGRKIGTTWKGIGPAYMDKAAREGLRAGDLLDPVSFREKLSVALGKKNKVLAQLYGMAAFRIDEIYEPYVEYGRQLAPHITETHLLVHEALARDERVLLEGAQGTLLDLDYGTYPYVTSSSTMAGSACAGAGIPPHKITQVMGVVKAYTTRVGAGPFMTEITDGLGDELRERGKEYGTTTGRPRRCGWLDLAALKFTASLNGFTSIALTKLDVLDELETIKVCTGYQWENKTLSFPPADINILEKCHPVYEELPGWKQPTTKARRISDLPQNTKAYIARIEEFIGVKVGLISVGPSRDETIYP